MELEIFSLRKQPPGAEPVHPDVAKVKAAVTYIPSFVRPLLPPGLALLLFAQLMFLFTAPRRNFAAARFHFASGNDPRLKDFMPAGSSASTLRRSKLIPFASYFPNITQSLPVTVLS